MKERTEPSTLADALSGYRFAYLLTSTDQASPHAAMVAPVIDGAALVVNGIGRRTRNNLMARTAVTLMWPPDSAAGYTLFVDGQAALERDSVRISPSRAVLHRPVPRPAAAPAGACGSDCIVLSLPDAPARA